MMLKKFISLFLFLVLSIQVLPMQQIASWLSSGQVTEEISHNLNSVKGKSGMDEVDPSFTQHNFHNGIHAFILASLEKHHHDEALFVRHPDDILAPPPNE